VTKTMVMFRGIKVIEGWPTKIQAAQTLTTCHPNGKTMDRVRYGAEATDWDAENQACHDCSVIKGELHVPGCDVESCPSCGGQIINCDCDWSTKKNRKSATKLPKLFSDKQLRIVAARKKFTWLHKGFAPDGDAIIEVTNRSDIWLPYLSIGVQGRGGTKLVGGAWLDVSNISPGTIGLVYKDCYKDLLLQEEVEFFSEEEPTPETKDRYWEFKSLPKKIK
jgi:hypothetical protein